VGQQVSLQRTLQQLIKSSERSLNFSNIFKALIINDLRIYKKSWHASSIIEGEFNKRKTMTLIIFISASLLIYGAFELKEAVKPTETY
jgi:hypothetical protein